MPYKDPEKQRLAWRRYKARHYERRRKGLCWHHDHDTGEFRAWLCHHCNLGFGMLGDTLGGAQQILDNLKRAYRETDEQRWILT